MILLLGNSNCEQQLQDLKDTIVFSEIEANGNSKGSTWGGPKAHSSDKDLPLLAIDIEHQQMGQGWKWATRNRLCLGHVGYELGHRPSSAVMGLATATILFLACQSDFLGNSEYRSAATQFGPVRIVTQAKNMKRGESRPKKRAKREEREKKSEKNENILNEAYIAERP
ncbi:hypothetical protein VNO77_02300 [Canavalia gladiata]|uniref:Uncharacterized protein n=1 Tax=Canavalia gladiata TaxID=3824 RepID=A0AAN9MTI3_CANGL